MRILLAHNHYQQPGGEDAVFRAEAELLRQHGHEVALYERSNDELEQINPLSAAVETVWSRRSQAELRRLIRRQRAEIVHFHNTFLRISPAAYYAAKGEGAAVVQTLHNYRLLCPVATFFRDGEVCEDCLGKALPWPGVLHACWRDSRTQTAMAATMLGAHRALGTWTQQVDRYIALTEFARQKFIQGGLPAGRIAVKPNFSPVPERPPVGEREDFALFVGRADRQKGIEVLVEAWQGIDDLELKIAGAELPPALAAWQQENIEWLGQRPQAEVLDLMERARLLVFPSLSYEGMPNAIIEAFSRRLPVLASRLGAMEAMIEDGVNGLLFEPGDPAALRQALAWARAHPSELQAIGQKGWESHQQRYSPEGNYQTLIKIYQQAKA